MSEEHSRNAANESLPEAKLEKPEIQNKEIKISLSSASTFWQYQKRIKVFCCIYQNFATVVCLF
jgi:hypothetical protein